MYKASEGGHLQVVELLLSKGAKVDSRDDVSTYNNVMYCVIVIIQSVCGIVYEVCGIRVFVFMCVGVCTVEPWLSDPVYPE